MEIYLTSWIHLFASLYHCFYCTLWQWALAALVKVCSNNQILIILRSRMMPALFGELFIINEVAAAV